MFVAIRDSRQTDRDSFEIDIQGRQVDDSKWKRSKSVRNPADQNMYIHLAADD